MKAGKKTSKEKEIIQQLKGAQCFVEYCQAIGKSFWEKQDFLDDYKYRFVSIKNITVIAMCAGIFTNCRKCPIAKSLI